MIKHTLLGLTLFSALALGCGSSTPAAADLAVAADLSTKPADMTTLVDMASAPADLGPVTVLVGNGGNNFSPADITVKAGQIVRWTWSGNGHNVVSGSNGTADNKFCSPSDAATCDTTGSPTSNTGTIYNHTFNTAGTFPYFCRPHNGAGMKGTVTVVQ